MHMAPPVKHSFILGAVYDRLTVIGQPIVVQGKTRSARKVPCLCACGRKAWPLATTLARGFVNSCGCFAREQHAKAGKKSRKHGESGKNTTPEYQTWANIKKRCYDVRHIGYLDYGGRGIAVCPEWLASYETFLQDVGRRPTPQHSIERIDTNGNYTPANVCWATNKEQANNRRSSRIIRVGDVALSVAEWSRKLGLHRGTVEGRLLRGWPEELAVTTKKHERNIRWGTR